MCMLLVVLLSEILVGGLETGDHHADKEVHDDEGYHHHIGEEKEGGFPSEGFRGRGGSQHAITHAGLDDVAAVVGGQEGIVPVVNGDEAEHGREADAERAEALRIVAGKGFRANHRIDVDNDKEKQAHAGGGLQTVEQRGDKNAQLRRGGEETPELHHAEQAQHQQTAAEEGQHCHRDEHEVEQVPTLGEEAVPLAPVRQNAHQQLHAEENRASKVDSL